MASRGTKKVGPGFSLPSIRVAAAIFTLSGCIDLDALRAGAGDGGASIVTVTDARSDGSSPGALDGAAGASQPPQVSGAGGRPVPGPASVSVALGDLDGDGDGDVAWVDNATGRGSIILNDGETFATQAVSSIPPSALFDDLNGDGLTDLAVVTNGTAGGTRIEVYMLLNDPSGRFGAPIRTILSAATSNPGDPLTIFAKDTNGDGIKELGIVAPGWTATVSSKGTVMSLLARSATPAAVSAHSASGGPSASCPGCALQPSAAAATIASP